MAQSPRPHPNVEDGEEREALAGRRGHGSATNPYNFPKAIPLASDPYIGQPIRRVFADVANACPLT